MYNRNNLLKSQKYLMLCFLDLMLEMPNEALSIQIYTDFDILAQASMLF